MGEIPYYIYDILYMLYRRPYLKKTLCGGIYGFTEKMLSLSVEEGLVEKKNVAIGRSKRIRTYYVLSKTGCEAIGGEYKEYAPRAIGAYNYFADVAKKVYGTTKISRAFLVSLSKSSIVHKLEKEHSIIVHIKNCADPKSLIETLTKILEADFVNGVLFATRNKRVADTIKRRIPKLLIHFHKGAIGLILRDDYLNGAIKKYSDFEDIIIWKNGMMKDVEVIKIPAEKRRHFKRFLK